MAHVNVIWLYFILTDISACEQDAGMAKPGYRWFILMQ